MNADERSRRIDAHLRAHHDDLCRRTDRMFAWLMVLQYVAGIVGALILTPHTWAGGESRVHIHLWSAILLGGAITFLPVALAVARPGQPLTRYVVSCAQALTSVFFIHLSGGRIETHFHVFGSLAFLACYRDWRVLVPATAIVAVDHLVRGIWWPQSVYGVMSGAEWRFVEHAAWVIFENFFLTVAILQSRREMREIAERRVELESSKESVDVEVAQRTTELRESEQRFRQLSVSSPVGIFQADRHGVCTYANGRHAEITGLGVQELMNAPWLRFVPSDHVDDFRRAWTANVASGQEFAREQNLRTPSGETRWVLARTRPLRDAAGDVTGHVGTLEDITERKRIEGLKNEFVSTVSHELRTPLTSIHGSLGLITGGVAGPLAPKMRTLIDVAYNNSARLVRLVSDILDMDKMESGKLALALRPLQLRPFLEQAIEANRGFAAKFGVQLQPLVAAEDGYVTGDPDRLTQVIANLVSNAVKFTPRDSSVTVSLAAGEGCGTWRVSVADQGPGIAHEFRGRIFQKFAQADGSDTRARGGSGLGLVIAKGIVERHGGRIGYDTELGKGTTFWFELPITAAAGEQAPRARAGARVLVCEDDSTHAETITRTLRERGYVVDVAPMAATARRLLAENTYAAMTLDLVLPDADGLALLAELRAGTRAIPKTVVVSRVRSAERDTVDMRTLGIVGWLDKPIDASRLVDAVRTAVNGQERRPRVLQVRDVPAEAGDVERLLGRPADVSSVATMQDAQRRLQGQEFDLVLVDVAARSGRVMLALSPAALERDGDVSGILARMAQEKETECTRR